MSVAVVTPPTPKFGVPTHRFVLSPPIETALDTLAQQGFAELRRSQADIVWSNFVQSHQSLIELEEQRLRAMGYTGDLNSKMFRSARYYRKSKNGSGQQEERMGAVRREYVATPETLLTQMDVHVRDNCFGTQPLSPKQGWAVFQEANMMAVEAAINDLSGTDKLTRPEAEEKIKKAYKNRHFLQRRKRQAAAAPKAKLDAISACGCETHKK
jgi:hypothetical protein